MSTDSGTSRFPATIRRLKKTILICLLVAMAGALAVIVIFTTEPEAQRETATRESAMLVDVTSAKAGTFRPTIVALGTVVPAREITLRPRASGEITEISDAFTPGGHVREGDVLVRIDDADYRNALHQRESELQQAIADMDIELGRQEVAEQDYRQLDRELPPDRKALVLREPQLRSMEAQIQSARAAVAQAQLNLDRTTVTAPFDAQVITREVNPGSQVAAGDPLARLVGVDTYWVETAIPVDKLRWLSFAGGDPQQGSPVELRNRTAWPEGATRTGYLYRLIGDLEDQTRLARALVAVEDPLGRKAASDGVPRLMIGEFLESRIRGRPIDNTLRLSRDYIRKGDTVWLMADGRLAIRAVDIVFRDAEYAYIRSGLSAQDRIVTTSLATIEEGVRLRRKESGAASASTTGLPQR